MVQTKTELEKFSNVNEQMKTEKLNLQRRLLYTKQKVASVKQINETDVQGRNSLLKDMKEQAQKQQNAVTGRDQHNASKSFETFGYGKYVNVLRETVMHLFTECNVRLGK